MVHGGIWNACVRACTYAYSIRGMEVVHANMVCARACPCACVWTACSTAVSMHLYIDVCGPCIWTTCSTSLPYAFANESLCLRRQRVTWVAEAWASAGRVSCDQRASSLRSLGEPLGERCTYAPCTMPSGRARAGPLKTREGMSQGLRDRGLPTAPRALQSQWIASDQ